MSVINVVGARVTLVNVNITLKLNVSSKLNVYSLALRQHVHSVKGFSGNQVQLREGLTISN